MNPGIRKALLVLAAMLIGIAAALHVFFAAYAILFRMTFGHPDSWWSDGIGQAFSGFLVIGLPCIVFVVVTYLVGRAFLRNKKRPY